MEKLDGVAAQAGAPSLLLQGAALAGETMKEHRRAVLGDRHRLGDAGRCEHGHARGDERRRSSTAARPCTSSPTAPAPPPRPARRGRRCARSPQQTHGEFTTIYAAASYQSALDRLADRMSSEMMIEYLVPVGSKPNDVKVGIRVLGARVRGLGVAPR